MSPRVANTILILGGLASIVTILAYLRISIPESQGTERQPVITTPRSQETTPPQTSTERPQPTIPGREFPAEMLERASNLDRRIANLAVVGHLMANDHCDYQNSGSGSIGINQTGLVYRISVGRQADTSDQPSIEVGFSALLVEVSPIPERPIRHRFQSPGPQYEEPANRHYTFFSMEHGTVYISEDVSDHRWYVHSNSPSSPLIRFSGYRLMNCTIS